MEFVLAHPGDRGELIEGAARGDDFALTMLCAVSNAIAEIRACGGTACVACGKLLRSRAARHGTFALALWEDDACAWRLFCARCASGRPKAELIEQAGESLIARMRFELHGAGAVAAVGHA
jgi:hypothetical protein